MERWRSLEQQLSTCTKKMSGHLGTRDITRQRCCQNPDVARLRARRRRRCAENHSGLVLLLWCFAQEKAGQAGTAQRRQREHPRVILQNAASWALCHLISPEALEEFVSAGLSQDRLCEKAIKSKLNGRLQRIHAASSQLPHLPLTPGGKQTKKTPTLNCLNQKHLWFGSGEVLKGLRSHRVGTGLRSVCGWQHPVTCSRSPYRCSCPCRDALLACVDAAGPVCSCPSHCAAKSRYQQLSKNS